MKNLIKAVNTVMLAAKNVEKNSEVGKGTRAAYKGVKDSDVKQLIQPLMAKNGLAIFQTSLEVLTEKEVWDSQYNGKAQRKQQVFTEVKVKYQLTHESGESMQLESIGYGVDTQDKGAGKAMTYALKMLLLYTFLIPSGEIDDTDVMHSNQYEISPKQDENEDKSFASIIVEDFQKESLLQKAASKLNSKYHNENTEFANLVLQLEKEEMKGWVSLFNNTHQDDKRGVSDDLQSLIRDKVSVNARKEKFRELTVNIMPI